MNQIFILGHFELQILKTDEGLTIEAENQQSSQLFSKTVTEDLAKSLSKDSFFDLATIHQVIQDFFCNRPQSVSLIISDEGKLIYNCQLSFGSVTKEIGFTIPLDKHEMDPSKKMEKTILRLSLRISELEKQVDKPAAEKLEKSLKDFEMTVLKKIEQLESRMEKRLEEMEEKIGKSSNSDTPQFENNLDRFSVSNECKTAECRSQGFLMAQEPFNMNQATSFSLRIENNDPKSLGFGVAPGHLKQYQHLPTHYPFQEKASYMYYSAGNVWKNGTSYSINLPVPQKGDVFTIAFNPLEGKLLVSQNNKQVDTYIYSKELLGSNIMYPFIYAQAAGLKVSFLKQ